jgi:micrococcal nuclease
MMILMYLHSPNLALVQISAEPSKRQLFRVVDGDTIVVQGQQVRLACIDAPEMKQSKGALAKATLAQLISRTIPQIINLGTDRYGRTVGIIYANNRNINISMVEKGYAFVERRYLSVCPLPMQNQLINAESDAKRRGKGVWADNPPEYPWIFRQKQRVR